MIEREFSTISIGEKKEFSKLISKEDVKSFAALTGDYNPLHMNEEYAKNTVFKTTIPHGMLMSSFLSTLIGMHLPGENCLYLSQNLNFRNPGKISEEILISGEVIRKIDALKILIIKTLIRNKNDQQILVEGEARVKVLENG